MLNALIFATLVFSFLFPLVGFVARAHDRIMARKQPVKSILQSTPAPAPKPFKITFKPSLEIQTSNILDHAPIRTLKAIAAVESLSSTTRRLFGKRYSLCNRSQLVEALTIHYAQ